MRSRPLRQLLTGFALALCLSLLPGRAGAVGLLELARSGAQAPAPTAPAPPESLWTALWTYVTELLSVQPAPPPTPPPDGGPTLGSDDQGVTLDPNG